MIQHRRVAAGQLFEKSLEKNPVRVETSFSCPWHRSARAMPRMTWSTCWPHPAQVAFWHFLHVTARHTLVLLVGYSGRELPADAFALGAILPGFGSAVCPTIAERLNRTAAKSGINFVDMFFSFIVRANSRRCVVNPASYQSFRRKDGRQGFMVKIAHPVLTYLDGLL